MRPGVHEEGIRQEVDRWCVELARSLTEALDQLENRLKKTLLSDKRVPPDFAQDVVCRLERITWRCNALCYGHWVEFNETTGAGRLRY